MGRETQEVRMTLRDQISQAANKIQNKLNMTGVLRGNIVSFNAFLDIGQKAFRMLGVGIKVVGSFIDISNEQIRVVTQLNAVLKSTGEAAGFNAIEIQRQAAALQQLTTFGDESIITAQNLLLTFTQIKDDVFPAATEIVLDMSEAMGQDLKASSILVGKALNDPILGVSALTRVGITFTDQQKEQIKVMVEAGDTMSAQRLILNELTTQFGGSAQAAAKTFSGRIKQLKNDFGDLQENIGSTITESADLKGLIVTISEIVRDLSKDFQDTNATLDDISGTGKNTFEILFDGIKFVRRSFVGLSVVGKVIVNTFKLIGVIGVATWRANIVVIRSAEIGIRSVLRATLELAEETARSLRQTDLQIFLQEKAQKQTQLLGNAQRELNKATLGLVDSTDKIVEITGNYSKILKQGTSDLADIDAQTIKWIDRLVINTNETRRAKEETEKLIAAETKLADDREFRKRFPLIARPGEEKAAPFSLFRGGLTGDEFAIQQQKDEMELAQRREFSFKLMEMNRLTEEEIAANAKKAGEQRQKDQAGVFGALLGLGQAFGAKNFKIQQATNIGQAIMNTHLAATKALAELGPIAGPIAAGLIAAAGFARVRAIASAKPGSSAGGGRGGRISVPRGGGRTFGAGGQFGGTQRQAGQNQPIVINFNGGMFVKETQAGDFIVDQLKKRLGRDGNTFFVNSGSAA